MWELLEKFLGKFYGTPHFYYSDYSIETILRCESTHFLSSAFVGFLAFWLTWIILSRKQSRWEDPYIFRISLLFGLCLSVTTHIIVDAFTILA